jgi:hypothetical protein
MKIDRLSTRRSAAGMTTPRTLDLSSESYSNFPGRPNPACEESVSSQNPFRIKETTAFETVGALIPLPRAITAREAGPFRCTNSRTRRSLIFESNLEATDDSIIDTFLKVAYKASVRKWRKKYFLSKLTHLGIDKL